MIKKKQRAAIPSSPKNSAEYSHFAQKNVFFRWHFLKKPVPPHGFINWIILICSSVEVLSSWNISLEKSLFAKFCHFGTLFVMSYLMMTEVWSYNIFFQFVLCMQKKEKNIWKSEKIEKITIKKSKYFKKSLFLGGRHLNVTPGGSRS